MRHANIPDTKPHPTSTPIFTQTSQRESHPNSTLSAGPPLLADYARLLIAGPLTRGRHSYKHPSRPETHLAGDTVLRRGQAELTVLFNTSACPSQPPTSCHGVKKSHLTRRNTLAGDAERVLLRDVAAGVVRHERRRDHADDRHDCNIDRDRVARSIRSQQRGRNDRCRAAGG